MGFLEGGAGIDRIKISRQVVSDKDYVTWFNNVQQFICHDSLLLLT
jgi:hypothetical protein